MNKIALVLAAAGGLSLFAGVAQAGLTYVSADRTLFADVLYYSEPGFDPAPPTTKSTDQLTPWTETAYAEFIDTDTDEAFATITQRSTLGTDGMDLQGHVDLRGQGEYPFVRASWTTVIEIDEVQRYSFEFAAFEEGADSNAFAHASSFATATLKRLSDDVVLFSLTDRLFEDANGPFYSPAGLRLNLDRAGLLDPGQYELTTVFEAGTNLEQSAFTDYRSAFMVTDDATPAVPLPAVVWPGVVMLAAIAYRRLRKA